MHRRVPLCAGQSGQKVPNGCQIKFERIFGRPCAAVSPGFRVRVIGTAIWSSAVLLSQPGKSKAVRRRWIVADDIRANLEQLRMLIDAGIRRLTNAFFNLIRRVHALHLGSTSSSIAPSSLGSSQPASRSMPETQNFDPVGFKRVHDNYWTFDEGAKIGSFSNPMSRFRKCIAAFDKVRFCAKRLIQFPSEPLLQAYHNVF
jgi:hypothetical protein